MGVLAFMAVSFLLLHQPQLPEIEKKTIEFQWVGAPSFVRPVFIRCFQNEIIYYDLFLDQEFKITFPGLIGEIQTKNGRLSRYLRRVVLENQRIKRAFGTTEHFPLLLIYPEGVVTAELLMLLIEQVEGLNVGLEPMMPHWEVPYQSES